MALSAELKLRLAGDEPLPKRLKLAENAYCCTDLAINRKEDIIVEWLCDISRTDVVVWKTLSLCTHCQDCNSRNTLSRRTKTVLIDTLIDSLKKDLGNASLPDAVLDCCNWVLQSPEMQHYFLTKINKLGLFLKQLFLTLKSDRDNTTVLNAIDSIVKIHKKDIDKDKLAETFLDYILNPLCELIDPNSKDNTNRVGAEAHKCMQQILFGKGRYAEYKTYFETKDDGLLPAKLFRTISKQANRFPDTIDYVFRAAAGSYKTDGSLVDNLFRECVLFSGDSKTVVANSLIQYLADIPLEYANEVDGISLTQFLANLIDQNLSQAVFHEQEYSLIRNITALNPLIVENKFQTIFKKVLLMERKTEVQERLYARLIVSILDASSRLRREQKLIPWLLLALHETLGENKDCGLTAAQILPAKFTSEFSLFAAKLNSSQVVAMLRSLTFHLKTNCAEEYETDSKNHVSLMAECTVSLLVSFCHGVQILEHTVPLPTHQKFVAALGQLGEVISSLAAKILNTKHDGRIMVVLLEAVLIWSKVQSLLEHYVPQAGAGDLSVPISDHDFKQFIQRVENFGDKGCRYALNNFLLHKARINPGEKQAGIIGKLEDSWTLILKDYPDLVSTLNSGQQSELASLVLKDILADGFEKWRETFDDESLEQNREFIVAVVCHTLIKIGSILSGSASAAITARIELDKILGDLTDEAPVPALNRKKLITDISPLKNLDSEDCSSVKKLLETLFGTPLLNSLSIPLRTMIFVTIYVIGRECELDEGIRDLCEKILFETVEEGGLNVFDFVERESLMKQLEGSKVLQKVFTMSLRNAEPSATLEHLAGLDSCPEEAVPAVLSCVENLKSKLNNEQRLALGKTEKILAKKMMSKVEKKARSAQKTRGLIIALKLAIGHNRIKKGLKDSIRATLHSIFVVEADDDDEDKENSTVENGKSNLNGNGELIKEGLELAAMALQHRSCLDLPEELISSIWEMVLRYPEAKILTPILEASLPKVFNAVLVTLHSQTETQLQVADIAKLNNTLGIWACVFKSDMGSARNKSRLNATRKLLQSLLIVDVVAQHWPDLIKLLLTIVKAKHMQLSGDYIDIVVMAAAASLNPGNLLVYDEVLILCLALLRSRVGIMTDRLPVLLQLYKRVISLIARQAKSVDATDRHLLALWALNIEKVTNALVKLKRDMLRVCPYLISDLVMEFAVDDLPDVIKESFKNCINSLLSICDPHGVPYLFRTLHTSKREIFKGLSETYNKFHRFTGKI